MGQLSIKNSNMMREFHMWGHLDSDIPIIGQKADGD